jgi:hypothetical protein
MDPIVLAKCWSLDDGTVCMLAKISERTWELRVTRGSRLFRVEIFSDLATAVTTADTWRTEFRLQVKIA